MERPKACGEHAIQFYGRECGLLKFRIYAGLQGRQPPPPSARRLVAFILVYFYFFREIKNNM